MAVGIIAVPIGYFVYLILLRIMMEFFIIVFRIGEDIRFIRMGGGQLGTGSLSPGGYPGQGPGGLSTQLPAPAVSPYPSPQGSLPAQTPPAGPSAVQQAPPSPVGQLSPDGYYRWDGTSWQPVQR